MIRHLKFGLRSAAACLWAACLGCISLLMPLFTESVVLFHGILPDTFRIKSCQSKALGETMQSSKSSNGLSTLKQHIQDAMKRKDSITAGREAHEFFCEWVHSLTCRVMEVGPLKTQLWNVQTEVLMSRVFVVTETMFPVFFVQ